MPSKSLIRPIAHVLHGNIYLEVQQEQKENLDATNQLWLSRIVSVFIPHALSAAYKYFT